MRSASFFFISVPIILLATGASQRIAFGQSTTITTAGFAQYWGSANPAYDLNGDGTVNSADLSLFLASQETGSTTGGSAAGVTSTLSLETPGAGTVAAAGPDAMNFLRNSVGNDGSNISVGNGFASATPEPGRVGSETASGGTARAIARWDFIPYRTIHEATNIGVVAFHMAGIEKVSFSANGGPWVDVHEMKRNPQTGVWEYFVTLRPEACADGRVEVRAIAWPKVGFPRVLQGAIVGNERLGEHSMVLWTNKNSALPAQERFVSTTGSDLNDGRSASTPMKTIAKAAASISVAQAGNAGGGTINLLPGTYAWSGSGRDEFGATVPAPTTTERWLTIRRMPGSSGDVLFTSNSSDGAARTKLLAIEGMKYESAHPSSSGSIPGAVIWISNCDLKGSGRADTRQWIDSTFTGGFLTQTRISNCAMGCNRGLYARDLHIEEIGKDGFTQIPLLLNSSLRDLARPTGQTWHCDVVQYMQTNLSKPNLNVVIYGFKAFDCRSQGFFSDTDPGAGTNPWRDFAIVNYFSEFSQGSNHTAQWVAPVDHLLVWNCSLIGGRTLFRAADGEGVPLTYKNVSVQSSIFSSVSMSVPCRAALTARKNHFVSGEIFGTEGSTGDPMFRNPLANDYHPLPNSPLVGRIAIPLVPVDSELNLIATPASVGSFDD